MEIFNKKPKKWGLRGDPELWQIIKKRFKDYDDPKNQIEFNKKLELEFNAMIKKGEQSSDEIVWFENFSQLGMSGGLISLEWWNNIGLPLLRKRYSDSL